MLPERSRIEHKQAAGKAEGNGKFVSLDKSPLIAKYSQYGELVSSLHGQINENRVGQSLSPQIDSGQASTTRWMRGETAAVDACGPAIVCQVLSAIRNSKRSLHHIRSSPGVVPRRTIVV
jgi:hypothetical protein